MKVSKTKSIVGALIIAALVVWIRGCVAWPIFSSTPKTGVELQIEQEELKLKSLQQKEQAQQRAEQNAQRLEDLRLQREELEQRLAPPKTNANSTSSKPSAGPATSPDTSQKLSSNAPSAVPRPSPKLDLVPPTKPMQNALGSAREEAARQHMEVLQRSIDFYKECVDKDVIQFGGSDYTTRCARQKYNNAVHVYRAAYEEFFREFHPEIKSEEIKNNPDGPYFYFYYYWFKTNR